MLLPALSKARAAAQQIKCKSNLKQIGLGYYMYSTDNADYIAPVYAWNSAKNTAGYWHGYIAEYIAGEFHGYSAPASKTIFQCPTIPYDKKNSSGVTFMANSYVSKNLADNSKTAWSVWNTVTSVSNPTLLFLTICGEGDSGSGNFYGTSGYYFMSVRNVTFKHNNNAGILFVDGHVDDVSKADGNAASSDTKHQCSAFHMADEKDIATIKSSSDSNRGLYN